MHCASLITSHPSLSPFEGQFSTLMQIDWSEQVRGVAAGGGNGKQLEAAGNQMRCDYDFLVLIMHCQLHAYIAIVVSELFIVLRGQINAQECMHRLLDLHSVV